MEVHHHPHIEKKGFKEYILEFLMIFLAVTLGFFAEGYREHLINHKKEREYVISLKDDLATDTGQLRLMINLGRQQYDKLDSLYIMLRQTSERKPVNMNRLYYLNFYYGFGLIYFRPNKRTISQIKNTGNFSLITDKACRDSLTAYDIYNDGAIQVSSQGYTDWMTDLDKMSQKIFNYDEVKQFGFMGGADVFLNDSISCKLITDDGIQLQEYANKTRSLMMILDIVIFTEQVQFERCKNLVALLTTRYHLK